MLNFSAFYKNNRTPKLLQIIGYLPFCMPNNGVMKENRYYTI